MRYPLLLLCMSPIVGDFATIFLIHSMCYLSISITKFMAFRLLLAFFHLTFFARFKLIYLTKVKVYQISDLGTLICSRRTFINIKLILPDPTDTW